MRNIKNYFQSNGDYVAIIPLTGLIVEDDISERTALFESISGSKLIHPNEFFKFLGDAFLTDMIKMIGTLEADFLEKSYIALIPGVGDFKKADQAERTLNTINYLLKKFLTCLWLSKDNCVNTEAGYLLINNSMDVEIKKRDVKIYFSNAYGNSQAEVEFNYKEIGEATQHAAKSLELDFEASKTTDPTPSYKITGKVRIDQFYTWTFNARKSFDIFVKIAMYIIALEALFSTSKNEVTHQLSERVALLSPRLEGISAKSVYDQIKKAYNLRSTALHGEMNKRNDKDLQKTSAFLDELCRQLLNKILTSEEFKARFQDEKSIDDFFHEKLFQ